MFTKRLLTDDMKPTLNQAALDIGIRTVDNFNKVLAEMAKYAFPAYTFCKQKRYLRRNLVKPRSMNRHSFISRLQELNAYLTDFPSDTECQESVPLPADEIMDIIYHSMPTTWKKLNDWTRFQLCRFYLKKMTDFFETRVKTWRKKIKNTFSYQRNEG